MSCLPATVTTWIARSPKLTRPSGSLSAHEPSSAATPLVSGGSSIGRPPCEWVRQGHTVGPYGRKSSASIGGLPSRVLPDGRSGSSRVRRFERPTVGLDGLLVVKDPRGAPVALDDTSAPGSAPLTP